MKKVARSKVTQDYLTTGFWLPTVYYFKSVQELRHTTDGGNVGQVVNLSVGGGNGQDNILSYKSIFEGVK